MSTQRKKWTVAEEERLLQQVRVFPQNLNKCFLIVSEVTGRTPKAVAAHWYQHTSKNPNNICFFTASQKHISHNRKNGTGIASSENIWRRLLSIIRNL